MLGKVRHQAVLVERATAPVVVQAEVNEVADQLRERDPRGRVNLVQLLALRHRQAGREAGVGRAGC